MAKTRCFDILKEIEYMSNNVRFSEDNPFQDLLAMTSAEDSKLVENSNNQVLAATKEYESLLCQEKVVNDNYTALEQKLIELEMRYEQLVSGIFVQNTTMESVEKLKEQIVYAKNVLNFYKQATGVRLSFNGPADLVAGYVAVKNDDPSKSELKPFAIKKSEKNIPDKIWEKMSAISETRSGTDKDFVTINEQH